MAFKHIAFCPACNKDTEHIYTSCEACSAKGLTALFHKLTTAQKFTVLLDKVAAQEGAIEALHGKIVEMERRLKTRSSRRKS